MEKIKKDCFKNDQFPGEEEREEYENSNHQMVEVIDLLKDTEKDNFLKEYIRDFKKIIGAKSSKGHHPEDCDEMEREHEIKREDFFVHKF